MVAAVRENHPTEWAAMRGGSAAADIPGEQRQGAARGTDVTVYTLVRS